MAYLPQLPPRVAVVDDNNLTNGRKPVKLQKESPAGCAGEGKQSNGNYRRRGKDGLKINRQPLFLRKKVSRAVSVR